MNLIFKILTLIYSASSYFKRKVFIKNIGKEDLVLDVGSGDKPFWRADVIVDEYLKNDGQRHSGSILYDKRKIFIQANVENLPFKDKVFDFVFCSHLLEHVENPDKAIKELTRVAKRGYIEVPNAILDLFKPFPPHLWYCSYTNNTLTFRQKEKKNNFFTENIEGFGRSIFQNSIFQYLLSKYTSKIFISLYWENSVNYRIIRAKYKKDVYEYKNGLNNNRNLYLKIIFLIYKTFYLLIVSLFYKKKGLEIKNFISYKK